MITEADYLESSFREKLLEHVFLSELLQVAWLGRGRKTVEVLKPEVDNAGYDLVLECQGTRRYVQLKSSAQGSSTKQTQVNAKLAEKLGGCVIWLWFDDTTDNRIVLRYLFLEATREGWSIRECPLARRTTANAQGYKPERRNTHVIHKTRFEEKNIADLFDTLFPDLNQQLLTLNW
ncbi:MAG: hypothetical protein F4X65_03335 [Chloroflexi bacterium]|nr:hypothetical protein [Chloroflexota bacterium]